jgi:hypothetical protein
VAKNEKYMADAVRIGERISAPVDIRVNAKGKGTIVISFKDQDELERIKKIFN